MNGENLAFYQNLPEKMEIFRGAGRERAEGTPWTIDREVAEGFAQGHRGIKVPDPVIAQTIVYKHSVLAVSTDRGESEILINPYHLQEPIHVENFTGKGF